MNDLISRQAAIDALGNEPFAFSEYESGLHDEWENNVEALMKLPSAQLEIIRCRDCKYASPNGKYGCKAYHFKLYETHEMEADDFCSRAERRTDG